jgi:membrane-bound ClpP family serine protease
MSSSLSLIAQTAAVMRALALLATLWVSPAQAADIYASQLLGTTIIHIDGPIEFGDEQKFAKQNYASATVRLTGPGGKIIPAIDIAKVIWKRGYTTLVNRENGRCASARAIIWLSGRKSAVQRN